MEAKGEVHGREVWMPWVKTRARGTELVLGLPAQVAWSLGTGAGRKAWRWSISRSSTGPDMGQGPVVPTADWG